jgi:gamma-glutamylcyclotransferase (GGCT)/AIG2-like uncharacterized protein YtfP
VGHIERESADEVWGVLWEVTNADLAALDDYEGVDAGAYVRSTVIVEHDGIELNALVYLAVPHGFKQPSKRYVDALVRGAEAHGVPVSYVKRLRDLV